MTFDDFLPIVASVLGTFMIIAAGAACRAVGWLTPAADSSLAKLTTNVLLPAYFFSNFVASDKLDQFSSVWLPPMVGFVTTTIGFLIAAGLAWTIGPKFGLDTDAKRRAFAICAGIANYGYFPIPLVEQFYPSAMIDLILHNVGVELSLWSIGIYIVAGAVPGRFRNALLSPPLMAVIASIGLRQTGLDRFIPASLIGATGSVGEAAIPMGLLLSGAIIVDFVRERRRDRSAAKVIAMGIVVRQCLLPVILLGFGLAIGLPWWGESANRDLQIVMMLQASMPAAVFPIVIVRMYNQDTQTALRVVLWTSVVGVVVIPGWIAVGTWFLNLGHG